jgi:hypothetical protein
MPNSTGELVAGHRQIEEAAHARSCPLRELRAAHESPWKPYHGSTPLKHRNMVCFNSSKSALSGVELSELLSHGLSVRFADLRLESLQEPKEQSMLELIMQMTEYVSFQRISSSEALASAQAIKGDGDRKGTIVRKVPPKRPLVDILPGVQQTRSPNLKSRMWIPSACPWTVSQELSACAMNHSKRAPASRTTARSFQDSQCGGTQPPHTTPPLSQVRRECQTEFEGHGRRT